jgi:hypothetical protein
LRLPVRVSGRAPKLCRPLPKLSPSRIGGGFHFTAAL